MKLSAHVLHREPSTNMRMTLVLAGVMLLLVLSACLPSATPSPTPTATRQEADSSSPVQGTPPPLSGPVPMPEETRPVPMESPDKGSGDTSGQAATGIAVAPSGGGGVAAGARPIVDQTYQWVGVVVVSTLEGRHLNLKRECDDWVLLPDSDAIARKLEENVGNKVVIWGRVFTGPSIYQRRAISVQSAFGPKDPMPMTLVAIPEYPCPGTPVPPLPKPVPPVQPIILSSGELAARGSLVWEQGKPYLSTPAGRLVLVLPPIGVDGQPAVQPAPSDATSAAGAPATTASLDVVAVGKWRLDTAGLELSAHTVRPWPVNLMAKSPCGNLTTIEPLQPGEISARGDLVWDNATPLLKTTNGPIQLSFATPEPMRPVGDAIVLGKFEMGGGSLHMTVRHFLPLLLPCPPPPVTPMPPTPSLSPGEIAAVGTLVWEGNQPYLDTPSGRILLLVPPDIAIPTPTVTARPGSTTQLAQSPVIAVGKWSIKNGQLTLSVRYLRPWPSPGDIVVPPQPPTTPPPPTPGPVPPPIGSGQGTIYGQVRIGPLCPVEPCANPPKDVYSSRALQLQSEKGVSTQVKLNPDGSFKAPVEPGTYIITLTDCSFLGCKNALPKKVTVAAGQAVQIDISIDTGIR